MLGRGRRHRLTRLPRSAQRFYWVKEKIEHAEPIFERIARIDQPES